jgi:hypothetical protein
MGTSKIKVQQLKIDSIIQIIKELERIGTWTYARQGDFLGDIPIVFTVQSTGRPKQCLGQFTPNSWTSRDGKPVHEINISAESLLLPVMDIVGIVIHNIVELWAYHVEENVCSKGGRHNLAFKEAAEMFGLEVELATDDDGKELATGWSRTRLGPKLLADVEKYLKPDYAVFDKARNAMEDAPAKDKTNKLAKWSCDCYSVRVSDGVELNLTCGLCSLKLVRQA